MDDFWKNVRRAVRHGLSEEDALKALTHTPAQLARAEDQLGSLQPGRTANFLITSGSLFEEDALIYENWIQGKPFVIHNKNTPDLAGQYQLQVGDTTYALEVSGKPTKPTFVIWSEDSTKTSVDAGVDQTTVTLAFAPDTASQERVRLSGYLDGSTLRGSGQQPDGTWVRWQATRDGNQRPEAGDRKNERGDGEVEDGGSEQVALDSLTDVVYPFMPFGRSQLPEAGTYLIRGATVWTNEEDGVLEKTDVLVSDGQIERVGTNLSDRGGDRD